MQLTKMFTFTWIHWFSLSCQKRRHRTTRQIQDVHPGQSSVIQTKHSSVHCITLFYLLFTDLFYSMYTNRHMYTNTPGISLYFIVPPKKQKQEALNIERKKSDVTWMLQQSPVDQIARSLPHRYLSPVCPHL